MPFIIQWIDSCTGPEQRVDVKTPAGVLALTLRQDVVCNMDWAGADNPPVSAEWPNSELDRYWSDPDTPVTIKLLKQGSAYRQQVWAALGRIPIGETLTYAGLAVKINSSARAVGGACRDNPYPLFIPCHRVIAASGLGGYCGQTDGWLMAVKRKLLAFEAAFKK